MLSGCKFFNRKTQAKTAVAKVGENILYEEDFLDIFSSVQSAEDSLKLRENYIKKWIQDEVLFLNALKNLTDSLQDKTAQLDLYYRSLIRYEYEKGLINQKLDTVVSESDISNYYTEFKENFRLRRRIVKAIFVLVTSDVPRQESVENLMKNQSLKNLDSLQKYCLRYGAKYNLNNQKWFYLDDLFLQTQLPPNFEVKPDKQPLRHSDSLKTAILTVNEMRMPGDAIPLQMATPIIRDIIKNKMKVDFINKMERVVYDEADRKGLFEIYE